MIVSFLEWVNETRLIVLGPLLLLCMLLVAFAGRALREYQERHDTGDPKSKKVEGQEGYIVSSVLGLLAFLLGFTFSLATDRFDVRRSLVLQDANAIGTAYLRTQLLGEPHRARLSGILISYTENRIVLAKAQRREVPPLLARDDELLTEIWAAAAAGFDSIKNLDFSSTFVDSINNLIDLDAARRAARQAHVPTEVFAVLLIYMIVAAGVLGYVLVGRRGRLTGVFLMGLFTLALLLIADIDRPTMGGINESQAPLEQLLASLKKQPTSVYDRWRVPSNPP